MLEWSVKTYKNYIVFRGCIPPRVLWLVAEQCPRDWIVSPTYAKLYDCTMFLCSPDFKGVLDDASNQ